MLDGPLKQGELVRQPELATTIARLTEVRLAEFYAAKGAAYRPRHGGAQGHDPLRRSWAYTRPSSAIR